MNVTLVATIALLALGGCHRPSSSEKRLIGTWTMPALTIIYDRDHSSPPPLANEMMEITFTVDHKEFWRYRAGDVQAVAHWHLEGNDLVFTMESQSEAGPPGTTTRQRITKITADELIFSDGSSEGRWTRVR